MSHIISSQAISRIELMKELEQYGLETCICTRGGRAVEFYRDGKLKRLPVPDIDKTVDTTGAGDVFCGGVVYGLIKDMSLDSAVNFAIHASSLSTRKHGVLHSFPTEEEIIESINSARVWVTGTGVRSTTATTPKPVCPRCRRRLSRCCRTRISLTCDWHTTQHSSSSWHVPSTRVYSASSTMCMTSVPAWFSRFPLLFRWQ